MTNRIIIAASAVLALSACNEASAPAVERTASAQVAPSEAPARVPAATPSPASNAAAEPATALPASDIGDPREVAQTWARAMENRDFGTAWAQFGNPPSTRADYARWWSRYRTIAVALDEGTVEGGAGSLYYTAHARLTGLTRAGKPYRLEGEVMVRRVNDVDGATPAQLRWQIGSAILEDVPA